MRILGGGGVGGGGSSGWREGGRWAGGGWVDQCNMRSGNSSCDLSHRPSPCQIPIYVFFWQISVFVGPKVFFAPKTFFGQNHWKGKTTKLLSLQTHKQTDRHTHTHTDMKTLWLNRASGANPVREKNFY